MVGKRFFFHFDRRSHRQAKWKENDNELSCRQILSNIHRKNSCLIQQELVVYNTFALDWLVFPEGT